MEKNKLYKGIYGLILTDIPDVQIVSPSDVTGHLIKENKMLYQWPKQIPDTKGPVHFTVKKMKLPYDERHFCWQLKFYIEEKQKEINSGEKCIEPSTLYEKELMSFIDKPCETENVRNVSQCEKENSPKESSTLPKKCLGSYKAPKFELKIKPLVAKSLKGQRSPPKQAKRKCKECRQCYK